MASRTPHPEQLSGWGRAQKARGWKTSRVEARSPAGELVGGAQLLERSVKGLLRIAYVPRGPILASSEPEVLADVMLGIRRHVRQRSLAYLAVTPAYGAEGVTFDLAPSGFAALDPRFPPRVEMTGTLVIDLAPPSDVLFGRFRRSLRNAIYQAQRAGVRVRTGGRGDLPMFHRLANDLCQRRGVQSNVGGEAFVAALWDQFEPAGQLHLFVTESGAAPAAAILMWKVGDWARAWRMGASDAGRDDHPTKLMFWETIRWARDQGCRYFDFVGFDADYARALQAGGEVPGSLRVPLSDYKWAFRGNPLPLHPGWCYIRTGIARRMLRLWQQRHPPPAHR